MRWERLQNHSSETLWMMSQAFSPVVLIFSLVTVFDLLVSFIWAQQQKRWWHRSAELYCHLPPRDWNIFEVMNSWLLLRFDGCLPDLRQRNWTEERNCWVCSCDVWGNFGWANRRESWGVKFTRELQKNSLCSYSLMSVRTSCKRSNNGEGLKHIRPPDVLI